MLFAALGAYIGSKYGRGGAAIGAAAGVLAGSLLLMAAATVGVAAAAANSGTLTGADFVDPARHYIRAGTR